MFPFPAHHSGNQFVWNGLKSTDRGKPPINPSNVSWVFILFLMWMNKIILRHERFANSTRLVLRHHTRLYGDPRSTSRSTTCPSCNGPQSFSGERLAATVSLHTMNSKRGDRRGQRSGMCSQSALSGKYFPFCWNPQASSSETHRSRSRHHPPQDVN